MGREMAGVRRDDTHHVESRSTSRRIPFVEPVERTESVEVALGAASPHRQRPPSTTGLFSVAQPVHERDPLTGRAGVDVRIEGRRLSEPTETVWPRWPTGHG
jgi:hypothetical protein